jgi:5-methylthioribose kinase
MPLDSFFNADEKSLMCYNHTMDKTTIVHYINATPKLQAYFNLETLHVSEIGDGNLNFVYRVSNGTLSLIFKYAPPYLRLLGEAFKLPQERICVEMHTMRYFESIAPSLVPKIFHCDEEGFCFVMEDLKAYRLLQSIRLEMEISLPVYAQLGRFLALLYTHKPPLHVEDFYENATLKAISENYIFRFPYRENHEALVVPSFFTPCAKSALFHQNIDTLTALFLTSKECLIHGDLHTGSVLMDQDDVKIIDAEFSLFAPLGFDMGVLFAHILFGEVYALMLGKTVQTQAALEMIWEHFSLHVKDVPCHVLQHSVGFCGAELFRRLVVPAKAKPLLALPAHLQPIAFEKVEKLAIAFVENYLHVKQLPDMLRLLKEHAWL